MFCIKCGAEAVAGNFCRFCFLEKNRLFEIEDFTAYSCDVCNKFERGDVKYQIKDAVKSNNIITNISIRTRQVGNRIYTAVACTGKIKPLKAAVTEERKMIVFVKKRKCENCVKILGGYYEACLQVRGERSERVMRKIEKTLPGKALAGIDRTKTGFDVRIVDKKAAAETVKYLRSYFDVKESYKLVGEKKGRKLYRNFYAIR